MHQKLKRGKGVLGVYKCLHTHSHFIDWLATERRVSLFCRGFQFFKYHIIYLSLGQILQLGDTFRSYEERERRKERKEEDG